MKIVRIKEIKNIGTFSNFSTGGALQFEKLTFIYGLNTYGKTTLADIFLSLKTNKIDIIQQRKTIPNNTKPQKITLTIKETSELEVRYENDAWKSNNISNHLEIFDTNFIHKNLFTGLIIERENKENFTQFIIGESGVKIANEIAEKRKELADEKKELKNKLPAFIKEKPGNEIRKFLDFVVDFSEREIIDIKLSQKKIDLQNELERLKEPQKILQLHEPDTLDFPDNTILETLKNINDLLQKNYSNMKDEVLFKFNEHINENFSSKENAENWIKSGLNYCTSTVTSNCPFCAQSLSNAQDLIRVYDEYFDEAYKKFIIKIEEESIIQKSKVQNTVFSQKVNLINTIRIIEQYIPMITNENFQSELNHLKEKVDALNEAVVVDEKNTLLTIVEEKLNQKNKYPHKRIDIIDFSAFGNALRTYNNTFISSMEIIKKLIESIQKLKRQYKDTNCITKKIHSLEKEIEDLGYKKARIEQKDECQIYVSSEERIKELNSNITSLRDSLEKDQSQSLDSCFSEINKLFKIFGSKNFTLEKISEASGHFPVYSLKVKFHNSSIANNQLHSIFSESDRRALAFSVFLTKINLKSAAEKLQTIIILDDPIVSFDDNRVSNTINILKETINQVSQIIILTHYPHFIKRFCEITRDSHIASKYLEIKQDDTTSSLIESDRKNFVMSDYDKIFLKIYDFINKKRDECIKSDLRPFLESLYLPTVFAKQINDKNVDCSSLEKMIDGIFDDQFIKTKLHSFRLTLNPDSHIFTSNNIEDIRNFASEMMNYLFSLNYEV